MPDLPKRVYAVVAALVALIGGGITVVVSTDDDGQGRRSHTISITRPASSVSAKVDSADPGTKPDVTIAAPKALVRQATNGLGDHQNARDETPPGMTPAQKIAARTQQIENTDREALPENAGLGAADTTRGCRTRNVVNQSSRYGVRPLLFTLHYTVSRNVRGPLDVNAIAIYFNLRSTSASSNYVGDQDGNCLQLVSPLRKAWAQAALNPVSVSWEQIATGNPTIDRSYCGGGTTIRAMWRSAGCRKLRSVFWQTHNRFPTIRAQAGAVSPGGIVTRSGIVTHQQLGTAGGGHHDISPYNRGTVIRFLLTPKRKAIGPIVTHKKITPAKNGRAKSKPPAKPTPRGVNAPQTISARGVAFIASFEGYRSCPYRDSGGTWTIGYGHTTGVTGRSRCLTIAAARALLASDLGRTYVPPVRALGRLPQGRFDALVSFVYNCGTGTLSRSTGFGARVHARDWPGAAARMKLYVHDRAGNRLENLVRRRDAEATLLVAD